MKKYAVALFFLLFLAGIPFFIYAAHEHHEEVVIPFESVLQHMPWPAAGDVRYHITIHKPYKQWQLWPGKGEMYKGTEPHGALLTTYVDKTAYDSIKKMKGMADLSIIVNENYASNKQLMSINVMYKVKGYNPEAGDWFWAKYDNKFNIIAEGKISECLSCHSNVKNNDYIYTDKVIKK